MGKLDSFLHMALGYPELSAKEFEKARIDIHVSKNQRYESNHTSKGNQPKWFDGKRFIKLNVLGYEDIAEVLSYRIMQYIKNISVGYVEYYPCNIYEDGSYLGYGSYSYSFLKDGEEEVSLGKLMENYGIPFSVDYDTLREEIMPIVGFDIGPYLDEVLLVDSITRNGDRHFYNISFKRIMDKYYPAPIYDNGDAFCSDIMMFPINEDIVSCYNRVTSKPFNSNFRIPNKYSKRLLIDKHILQCITEVDNDIIRRCKKILELSLSSRSDIEWIES